MKTPKFWNNKNIVAFLLLPLSMLYYFIYKLRCFINFNPYNSKIPVICVGNIVAGGAGKTPTAIEIAKILKQNNKTFCFLSKGYGGKFKGVVKLDNNSIAEVVGDEPLLLFEFGDVFVSFSVRLKYHDCIFLFFISYMFDSILSFLNVTSITIHTPGKCIPKQINNRK